MHLTHEQNIENTSGRVVYPEKKAYLLRNKNPSVIWIMNDQNSSKWSLEGFYGGSTAVSSDQHLHG